MKTLKQYLSEKDISQEDFDGYSAEKKAEIFNEINESNSKEFKKLKENVESTQEEIKTAQSELIKMQKDQMDAINAALKEHGLAIKALSENEKKENANVKSLKETLKENEEKLKGLATNDRGVATASQFAFKVAGDMTFSNSVSGGNIPVEDRLSGLNMVPSRRIRLMDLVSRGTTSSNVVSWVYQANQDGTVTYTAEGATKNQIDFDLVVASESVQKITAFIKVSTEMLNDIDYIESVIRIELLKELLKKVETEVYSGAGGGSALNGITTLATAFAAGSFALAVDNANQVDVLTVAMNQIAIAEQDPATAILMHPSDVTFLKMVKVSSTDKRYVERLAMVAGELSLDGTPIIPTTLVTQGTYTVADFSKVLVLDREPVRIDIGLDGNDFTKNMRTILAEWRGVEIIKNNDRTAIVSGTFATDQAALETA